MLKSGPDCIRNGSNNSRQSNLLQVLTFYLLQRNNNVQPVPDFCLGLQGPGLGAPVAESLHKLKSLACILENNIIIYIFITFCQNRTLIIALRATKLELGPFVSPLSDLLYPRLAFIARPHAGVHSIYMSMQED